MLAGSTDSQTVGRSIASSLLDAFQAKLFVCTICVLRIYFDPAKNERNIRDRGLSFESAADFDFETALVLVDDRREYGEVRYVGLGYLAERLHVLCFAEAPDGIRVISFRKANFREVARHAKVQTAR